jgi:hypothetical protein
MNNKMFKLCVAKKSSVVPEPVPVKEKVGLIKEQSQCLCHEKKGLPGWCGVAGGGVPACDH